jgi:hypothetical protein
MGSKQMALATIAVDELLARGTQQEAGEAGTPHYGGGAGGRLMVALPCILQPEQRKPTTCIILFKYSKIRMHDARDQKAQ